MRHEKWTKFHYHTLPIKINDFSEAWNFEDGMPNDLAMLTLGRKIDFSNETIASRISCVCDPLAPEKLDLTKCKAFGWGIMMKGTLVYSNDLLQIDYPGKSLLSVLLIDSKEWFDLHLNLCFTLVLPTKYCDSRPNLKIEKNMYLCAGYKE